MVVSLSSDLIAPCSCGFYCVAQRRISTTLATTRYEIELNMLDHESNSKIAMYFILKSDRRSVEAQASMLQYLVDVEPGEKN